MPASSAALPDESPNLGRIIGAIPARYDSVRLPGKPLREIAGKTLIEHVYRRASAATTLDEVVVLTDDERIGNAVRDFGGDYQMTPRECASGTDRIAFAARDWNADAIVNIQGDEPLIEPQAIDRLAQHLRVGADAMATLAAPASPRDLADVNVVKVVTDLSGKALYFSRAAIPFCRDGGEPAALRHIGIYGYTRQTLLQLTELEPSPLERQESLEQLRALENGIAIRVLRVARAWQGVDTIEDLQRIESLLSQAPAPTA